MIEFNQYIPSFCTLLEKVTVDDITEDEYAASYLSTLLGHKEYYLSIYCLTLQKAFEQSGKHPDQSVLLDIGTGNGLLALFVKHCGVNKVFASDTNNDFLSAAKKLATFLHIEIDGWVNGDENVLPEFFSRNPSPDIIIGTDVIEHIYDLNELFKIFKQINPKMVTVFTTASVAENSIKSYQLKKLQQKDELEDSNAFHSSKDNEFAGVSFFNIRQQLIKIKYPFLQEDEIIKLAKSTRGLKKKDIFSATDKYITNKTLPKELSHSTNTCDPITGSWTERLLTIKEYEKIYQNAALTLTVFNGYYNAFENGVKSRLLKWLNKCIFLAGKNGRMMAPFIVLVGKPK